jgi:hypothetical protein
VSFDGLPHVPMDTASHVPTNSRHTFQPARN